MNEKVWETVKEWRDKGIVIFNEEASMIYSLCLRKMEISEIDNPDDYIESLFADEIKNYLIRQAINMRAYLKVIIDAIGIEHFISMGDRRVNENTY